MTQSDYDLIVIGAGPVGENVADRARQGGLTVAIIERELVGGDCSYWACVPSKTLLRSTAALDAARSVDGARQAVTGDVDVAAVLRRRTVFTRDWNDASDVEWLADAGIDLIRGAGSLLAPREVRVTSDDGSVVTLRARHAVAVCTGSAARLPDVPGLAEIEPWTSREATSTSEIPESLAIIGGGVVGTEMATAYAGLGAKVHLIVRSPLLERLEPFAAEAVSASLEARGVTIHRGVEVQEAHRTESNAVLTLTDGSRVIAKQVLIAIGRVPRTIDLGLENVGLQPGAWLPTDDTMRVAGTDWLYAVGDVTGRALLTHEGKYQARAAGDVIAARAKDEPVHDEPWGVHAATADHIGPPQVIFTDPEVASAGITAAAAREAGLRIRVLDYDLANVTGAALRSDSYAGHARAIVDEDRGVLVGVTFVGPDVAELVHAATIAIVGEVPLSRLWHAVPVFPTVSEVWLRLLEAYQRPPE